MARIPLTPPAPPMTKEQREKKAAYSRGYAAGERAHADKDPLAAEIARREDRRLRMYCAALTGILANPNSMPIGTMQSAEYVVSQAARVTHAAMIDFG